MPVLEPQIPFPDARSFRAWLVVNHSKAKVLWLVFPKMHTGRRSVSYEEAVRQALCFGWIDSIIKRLDDEHFLRKFTPRTDKARWSRINVNRAIELIESGQMTKAGYAVLPARNVAALKRLRFTGRPDYVDIPGFVRERLRQEARALAFFNSLPPSLRRNYLAWITGAKREGTRRRRLEKAVGFLSRGQRPLL
jgi:uncharacterized protein YdeI (YjbR/CyaY-like superfamily)